MLPDGHGLLLRVGANVADAVSRLARLPLSGDLKPHPMNNTSGVWLGEISPDGRWLVYQPGESSTQEEIWVRPYPDTESARWKISTNGGQRPMWSRSGREIFYRESTGRESDRLMAVPVSAGAAGPFEYGAPHPLMDLSQYSFLSIARTYDISADGSRFLFLRRNRLSGSTPDSLTVIVNWAEELPAKLKGQ